MASPSPAPRPTMMRCPFCRRPFTSFERPENVKQCPVPYPLPGDTAEQRKAGGRACGAYLAGRLVGRQRVYPLPEVI